MPGFALFGGEAGAVGVLGAASGWRARAAFSKHFNSLLLVFTQL